MTRAARFLRRVRSLAARGLGLVGVLPRALRRFASLPAAERSTTVRALLVMVWVELLIRWRRLPVLSRQLGVRLESGAAPRRAGSGAAAGGPAPDVALPPEVVRTRRCVARLVSIWPLGAGPCLRESLTLGALVRDYHPVLRLGVARHGPRIRAHAWIEIDDMPVNDPLGFVAFQQDVEAAS
jgi:hypothetical protein